MNGQSNNGVTCVGRRYGAEFPSNVHHYIWTAPDADVGPIEVKVTGANGEFEPFKFNSVTLEYDEAIKRTIPPGPLRCREPATDKSFRRINRRRSGSWFAREKRCLEIYRRTWGGHVVFVARISTSSFIRRSL